MPGGFIFSQAEGTVDFSKLEPAILSTLPREELAVKTAEDEILQSYTGLPVSLLGSETLALLRESAVNCASMQSVSLVRDNTFDRVV